MSSEKGHNASIRERVMARVDHGIAKLTDTSVIQLPLQDGTVFEMHLWEPLRGVGVVMSINDEYLVRVPESAPVHIEQGDRLLERRKIKDNPSGIRRLKDDETPKYFTEFRTSYSHRVWRPYDAEREETEALAT